MLCVEWLRMGGSPVLCQNNSSLWCVAFLLKQPVLVDRHFQDGGHPQQNDASGDLQANLDFCPIR